MARRFPFGSRTRRTGTSWSTGAGRWRIPERSRRRLTAIPARPCPKSTAAGEKWMGLGLLGRRHRGERGAHDVAADGGIDVRLLEDAAPLGAGRGKLGGQAGGQVRGL